MAKRLTVGLAALVLLGAFPYAYGEMKIELKGGASITVPVNKEDIVGITFGDKTTSSASSETLTIPNDKPVKVKTAALEKGRWYLIEASGVFSDWGDHKDGVDAVWCYAEWRCGKEGQAWNQLRIDDKGMMDIAGKTIPYNSQHTYQIRYQGQGRPIEIYCSDAQNSWQDNSGAITVKITPE
jgi:hypothetical protein